MYGLRTSKWKCVSTRSTCCSSTERYEFALQPCYMSCPSLFLSLMLCALQSLLKVPFAERRALLHRHFRCTEHRFRFATYLDTPDEEQLETFFTQAVRAGCEGLMIKTLRQESTYEPSKRSNKWLKVLFICEVGTMQS